MLLLSLSGSGSSKEIEAVLVHPVFDQPYLCSEHWDGQFRDVGDALGVDCFIHSVVEDGGKTWLRPYKADGGNNEDWYGWQANVLAPFDSIVRRINVNPHVNRPGVLGAGIASFVILENDADIKVMVAHVDNLSLKVGQRVKAGQVIARVGNNGQSRHPHVHIGAWKGSNPLQIRFDQRRMPRT